MCKSYIEGYKRCEASAETKAKDSLRKAISYQAKKGGVPVEEWKDANPDQLKLINDTYDERLKRFENDVTHSCDDSTATTPKPKKDGVGVTTFQKILNRLKNIKSNQGFAKKGEMRSDNTRVKLYDYDELSRKYLEELNLSKDQRKAVYLYTNQLYSPINSYLLGKKPTDEFKDFLPSWKDISKDSHPHFRDEEDLHECIRSLDATLSRRYDRQRIIYRGMGVGNDHAIMLDANNGKKIKDIKTRKRVMEQTYQPGSELVFDAYSSASDRAEVAADWCSSGYRGINPYNAEDSDTGVIFEIKSNAGVPVAHLSGHSEEREILMPRGLRFNVANSYWNSHEKSEGYKYKSAGNYNREANNPNTLIVQLVEIDEHGDEIMHRNDHQAPPVLVQSKLEGDGK